MQIHEYDCIVGRASMPAAGLQTRPIPLRKDRVLEDPRRPGGLPHNI
jgi:hypothetical protein